MNALLSQCSRKDSARQVKCQIIGDNIDAATLDATISILPKWALFRVGV
jgi:hypothetical protein